MLAEVLDVTPAIPAPVVLDPLPADVWEFARRCCWTYDQRAEEFGREVEEQFPDKAYLEFVLREIAREPLVWIEKSSQILISWAVAVWAVHDVLLNRGHDGAWFCLDRTLAAKHLEERVWRLYNRIPANFAKPSARILGGDFEVYHDGDDRLATSSIRAMAQETSVADQAAKRTRSWTWTWAHIDEAAFTRKQEELIGTLQNRCGKIVAPSTPDGPATYHHRIGYGKSLDAKDAYKLVEVPEGQVAVMEGVTAWRRFGWRCLDVGFDADPEKRPSDDPLAWWNHPSTVSARRVTAKWAREMLRSARVMAGTPVYNGTERIASGPQEYFAHLPLIRGHDYSFLWNVALVMQLQRAANAKEYRLAVLREVYTEESFIIPHKQRVLKDCHDAYGQDVQWYDYGDYSANERTPTGVLVEEMRPEIQLVTVPTGPGGVRKRTELVQYVIAQGWLAIDKEHCPMLWQAIENGYVRDRDGDPIGGPAGHPWADFADALGYAVTNIFELHPLAGTGSVLALKEFWTRNLAMALANPSRQRPTQAAVNTRSDGVVLPRNMQR